MPIQHVRICVVSCSQAILRRVFRAHSLLLLIKSRGLCITCREMIALKYIEEGFTSIEMQKQSH